MSRKFDNVYHKIHCHQLLYRYMFYLSYNKILEFFSLCFFYKHSNLDLLYILEYFNILWYIHSKETKFSNTVSLSFCELSQWLKLHWCNFGNLKSFNHTCIVEYYISRQFIITIQIWWLSHFIQVTIFAH